MSKTPSDSDAAKIAFTGRIARWSAVHRWVILTGTVALLVGAFFLNSSIGVKISEVFGAGDARHGQELIVERFDIVEPSAELILFSNPTLDADDPAFRSTVEPLVAELRDLEGVASVVSYYDMGLTSMLSDDRHVLMARLEFKPAEQQELSELADPVVDTVIAANQAAGDGFEIGLFGGTSATKAINTMIAEDFNKILLITLIGGLIIIVLAFGAVVAAVIPLILALVSIFAAVGAAVFVSQVQALNTYYYEMIILMGLAVGIDYSLFIVNRFREERASGRTKMDAIRVASNTTGRAVFYAGITVVASLSGLVLTGDTLFIGLGLGAVIVVIFAIIGSLTLLPALLSLLGDRVNRLRVPSLWRTSRGEGVWGTIIKAVLARPLVFATITLAGMIALSMPVFSLHIGNTPFQNAFDWESAANRGGSMGLAAAGLELMDEHFTLAETNPIVVVVDPGVNGNVDTPGTQDSVARLIEAVDQDDSFVPPFDTQVSPTGNLLLIIVPPVDPGNEDQTADAVRKLRNDIIPEAFLGSSVEVFVDGGPGYTVDAIDNAKSKTPVVFAYVLGLAFLILLLMFRSIVIPIKAILLNLLSVGAAYGVLVLVFQEGLGEGLLNFEASGIIEIFMPLFLFAVLFGLSMDYHMLLLNRIKEAYDEGYSNEESVSMGIKKTAALITSAALIMVLVFGAFATSSAMIFKQIGVGLGVAIFIDATIVRAVLLPATMKLLGDWNWYLPKWLNWLPRISPEGRHETAPRNK